MKVERKKGGRKEGRKRGEGRREKEGGVGVRM